MDELEQVEVENLEKTEEREKVEELRLEKFK